MLALPLLVGMLFSFAHEAEVDESNDPRLLASIPGYDLGNLRGIRTDMMPVFMFFEPGWLLVASALGVPEKILGIRQEAKPLRKKHGYWETT